jgi:hypothetical protein
VLKADSEAREAAREKVEMVRGRHAVPVSTAMRAE